MKTRNTITKLTITVAVAALAAAGLVCLQPVAAQSGDGSVKFVRYASIGIIPGEKIRLSAGNNTAELDPGPITWTYRVTNTGSTPLYESGRIQVPSGEFRISDVSRRDLKTEGDPLTGREEVMVRATIEARAGSNPEDFPISAEVIKEETGGNSEVVVLHEFGHWMGISVPQAALIGFTPEERLSLTVFNPPDGGAAVRATTWIYDATGRIISRSAEVELPSDQSYTFAFNGADFPGAGEEKTGRVQVLAVVKVASMDGSACTFRLPVRVSLVNNRTGSTSGGGDYYTGTVSVSGEGE